VGTLLASNDKSGFFRVPASAALIVAPITGGVGALIGALVGGIAGGGKSKKIQINGKNDDEISAILEDLRSKARMPDAQ